MRRKVTFQDNHVKVILRIRFLGAMKNDSDKNLELLQSVANESRVCVFVRIEQ